MSSGQPRMKKSPSSTSGWHVCVKPDIFSITYSAVHKSSRITHMLTSDLPQKYECSFAECIAEANGSAAALVNLLAEDFPCFRDEAEFDGKKVRFYKRAQILVADIWACFQGEDYGEFYDIDKITMFAGWFPPPPPPRVYENEQVLISCFLTSD